MCDVTKQVILSVVVCCDLRSPLFPVFFLSLHDSPRFVFMCAMHFDNRSGIRIQEVTLCC